MVFEKAARYPPSLAGELIAYQWKLRQICSRQGSQILGEPVPKRVSTGGATAAAEHTTRRETKQSEVLDPAAPGAPI